MSRGAPDPDPDPAGYPVNFVDPVRIRIWPDPETVDPDPAGSRMSGSGWDPDPVGSKTLDPAGSY